MLILHASNFFIVREVERPDVILTLFRRWNNVKATCSANFGKYFFHKDFVDFNLVVDFFSTPSTMQH